MRGLGFVVAGCPRSGTAFAAKLFSKLLAPHGLSCGHERTFSVARCVSGSDFSRMTYAPGEGDSSFLAVPYLEQLPKRVRVLHLWREPVDWLRSFSEHGMTRSGDPFSEENCEEVALRPWVYLVYKYEPALALIEDRLERAVAFWALWNQRILDARGNPKGPDVVACCKAGDLSHDHVRLLLEGTGYVPNVAATEEALTAVGTRVNHATRDEGISWSSVPDGYWKKRAEFVLECYLEAST